MVRLSTSILRDELETLRFTRARYRAVLLAYDVNDALGLACRRS